MLYGLSSKLKCCISNVVGSSPLCAVSQASMPTELSKVLCNFSCAWGKDRLLYKSAHLFPGCFIRALHLQNATKMLTCNQRKVCYDSKSQVSKIQPTNLQYISNTFAAENGTGFCELKGLSSPTLFASVVKSKQCSKHFIFYEALKNYLQRCCLLQPHPSGNSA